VPIELEKGYLKIPTGPGLVTDLNEEALARHPYQPRDRSMYAREHYPLTG